MNTLKLEYYDFTGLSLGKPVKSIFDKIRVAYFWLQREDRLLSDVNSEGIDILLNNKFIKSAFTDINESIDEIKHNHVCCSILNNYIYSLSKYKENEIYRHYERALRMTSLREFGKMLCEYKQFISDTYSQTYYGLITSFKPCINLTHIMSNEENKHEEKVYQFMLDTHFIENLTNFHDKKIILKRIVYFEFYNIDFIQSLTPENVLFNMNKLRKAVDCKLIGNPILERYLINIFNKYPYNFQTVLHNSILNGIFHDFGQLFEFNLRLNCFNLPYLCANYPGFTIKYHEYIMKTLSTFSTQLYRFYKCSINESEYFRAQILHINEINSQANRLMLIFEAGELIKILNEVEISINAKLINNTLSNT